MLSGTTFLVILRLTKLVPIQKIKRWKVSISIKNLLVHINKQISTKVEGEWVLQAHNTLQLVCTTITRLRLDSTNKI